MFTRLKAEVPLHSRVKILTIKGDEISGELVEVADSYLRLVTESGFPAMLSGPLVGGYWVLGLPPRAEISIKPLSRDEFTIPECSEKTQPSSPTGQDKVNTEPVKSLLPALSSETGPISQETPSNEAEPELQDVPTSEAEAEPQDVVQEVVCEIIVPGTPEGNPEALVDDMGPLTHDDRQNMEVIPLPVQPQVPNEQQDSREDQEYVSFQHHVSIRARLPGAETGVPGGTGGVYSPPPGETINDSRRPYLRLPRPEVPPRLESLVQSAFNKSGLSGRRPTHFTKRSLAPDNCCSQEPETSQPADLAGTGIADSCQEPDTAAVPEPEAPRTGAGDNDATLEAPPGPAIADHEISNGEEEIAAEKDRENRSVLLPEKEGPMPAATPALIPDPSPEARPLQARGQMPEEQVPGLYLSPFGLTVDFYHASSSFSLQPADLRTSYPKKELGVDRNSTSGREWERCVNLVQIGKALHDRKRLETALDFFRRTSELVPASPTADYNAGSVALDLELFAEARERLERSYRRSANPDALLNLACAWAKLNEPGRAYATLARLLEDEKDLADADTWASFTNAARSVEDFGLLRSLVEKLVVAGDNPAAPDRIAISLKALVVALAALGNRSQAEEIADLLERGTGIDKVWGRVQEVLPLVPLRRRVQKCRYQSYIRNTLATPPPDETTASTGPQEEETAPDGPMGFISAKKENWPYGFIKGNNGATYYFQLDYVTDPVLRERLGDFDPGRRIFVLFEVKPPFPGGSYERAVNVREWSTEDRVSQTLSPVFVSVDPASRPGRPATRTVTPHALPAGNGVPPGDTIESLLIQQVNDGHGTAEAIKTLVDYYSKTGNDNAAIELLEQKAPQIGDGQYIDTQLVKLHFSRDSRGAAMEFLESMLKKARTPGERSRLLLTAGELLVEAGEKPEAEATLLRALDEDPESSDVILSLLNFYEQSNRRGEGFEQINKRLPAGSSPRLQALIGKETESVATGREPPVATTRPAGDATPLSAFSLFFLERAEFSHYKLEGPTELDGERMRYTGDRETAKRDIRGIEDRARKSGTTSIKSRAGLYLLAAKVAHDAELGTEEIVKYLYRSFRSFGDEILEDERKHIESAMAFYYESLRSFDRLNWKGKADEPLTILVRFLRAIVEERYTHALHGTPKVSDALDFIFGLDPAKSEQIYDHISYLIPVSRLAAEEILKYVATRPGRLEEVKGYLIKRGISDADGIDSYERLNALWRTYRLSRVEAFQRLVHGLKGLHSPTLFQGQFQEAAELIDGNAEALLFDLDRDRLASLKVILSSLEHFHVEEGFEERERLLQLGMQECVDLRREIGEIPTSFAIGYVLPVIDHLQSWAGLSLEELYRTSLPKLTIRLRKEEEWFSPDRERAIEVQVVFANEKGCSPIESLEYTISGEEGSLYHPVTEKDRLARSLKGGDSEIRPVKLRVDEEALVERTFTLQVTAQFRSRSQDGVESVSASLPIRLYPAGEFTPLANPYVYANAGAVEDPAMFFGRDELITNIIATVQTSPQANCHVIFGQKRSGKSSILYHIKRRLSTDPSTIVIDIGDVSLYFSSSVPFFTQLLADILGHLAEEIRTRFSGTPLADVLAEVPTRSDVFADPTPYLCFKEAMGRIRAEMRRDPAMASCRVVVLIDEFSYLYEQILRQKVPREFMKQWKALLQENFFKAIIAGQDVMPKFKMAFPNEFGTSQDERITYLAPDAARRLIEDPIRIGGTSGESRYVEKSVEHILNLTGRNPFYVQIVCSKLVELMNSTRSLYVSQYEVSRVRDELVKGTNRLGQDKFENLYNSGDTSPDAIPDSDCLRALRDIAINSRNGPCPRQKITCRTETDIETVLADLVYREVIAKDQGDHYTIRVGLFREWLLENSLSIDEKGERVDNPFSDYGIAVSGAGFIGRDDVLAEINQRVVSASRPGNLAIIGLPRIGKTSVARQAVATFGAALVQNKRIPVEIDISIFSDVDEFFKALLLESNAAIERYHVPAPGVDPIVLDIGGMTKDSVEFKLGIQKYFKEVRRAGIYLVLFLDEFDKIVDIFQESPAWIQLLRDLASNPDYPVRLVTTSRREISELERRIGDGGQSVSNLHGIFQTHFLGGFTGSDLHAFFNKLSHAGVHMEDEERRQMVDLCGPFPYYLHAAAYQLVEGYSRGSRVDLLDAVENVQPELVENYQHICQLLEEKEILGPFLAYLFNEDDSTRNQEFDLLNRYGLVRPENGQYVCASKKFHQHLKSILPVVRLWDRLGLAERSLRDVVTAHFRARFGDDWVGGLEKDSAAGFEIMDQCRRYRYTAEQNQQNLSPNLIDYSTTPNLFKLAQLYWDAIAPTLRFETPGAAPADISTAWKAVAGDVIAARGIHAHNNQHLLTDDQTQQYAASCERLISWIKGDTDPHRTGQREVKGSEPHAHPQSSY